MNSDGEIVASILRPEDARLIAAAPELAEVLFEYVVKGNHDFDRAISLLERLELIEPAEDQRTEGSPDG